MSDTDKEANLALSLRFHDQISNIVDRLDDEGDRVFLGSTNDADLLRDIAENVQEIQLFKDEVPYDWRGRVTELVAERDALKARVAALEIGLNEIAAQKTTDEIKESGVDLGDLSFRGGWDQCIRVARHSLVEPERG